MFYSNYYNHQVGNNRIYSKKNLLEMSLKDMLDKELELAYQYNTIGIPTEDELLDSDYSEEYKRYNGLSNSKAVDTIAENSRLSNIGGVSSTKNIIETKEPVFFDMGIQKISKTSIDGSKDNNVATIKKDFDSERVAPNFVKTGVAQENYYAPYDEVINNPDFTDVEKEQKIQEISKIQEQANARNKEIEREHKVNMAKIVGKEVFPYMLPNMLPAKVVSGVNKITKPVVDKVLPKVGDAIKRKIGEDVSRSLLVSPITSVSEAIEEDKNIATTILKNAPVDILIGSLDGAKNALKHKRKRENLLQKEIEDWNIRQKQKYVDKNIDFYDDYIKGTKEDDGIYNWLRKIKTK